jgi:hypothetical protein
MLQRLSAHCRHANACPEERTPGSICYSEPYMYDILFHMVACKPECWRSSDVTPLHMGLPDAPAQLNSTLSCS